MLKNDLELNGGARKKKQQAEKTALTLPPTTLPQPSLRTLPPREESKAPAELDPAVKAEKAAKVKTSAARGGSSVSAAPASSAGASGGDLAFHMPGEDEELRQRYESALAELEELRGAAPRYDSRYDGQIRELEREARDIPQRKAQEIARLNGVNAALEIAKSQLAAMQQRIKNEGIKGEGKQTAEDHLQGYFTKRVEKFLHTKGKRLIGWDELLGCDVDVTSTIMSWRGAEPGAGCLD